MRQFPGGTALADPSSDWRRDPTRHEGLGCRIPEEQQPNLATLAIVPALRAIRNLCPRTDSQRRGPEVLVLYLKRPRAKSWELRGCGGALQIQRLEGSRPGGLWDLYLDEPVLIVCEFAVAVRALGLR
jgi:hypothetical protein